MRLLTTGFVDGINAGMDPSCLGARVSEEGPDFRGERVVTGYVEGAYLSAKVESVGPNSSVVRGFLRGEPIDFRVTTASGYMDLSTSVPGLRHDTAAAIWRIIISTVGVLA